MSGNEREFRFGASRGLDGDDDEEDAPPPAETVESEDFSRGREDLPGADGDETADSDRRQRLREQGAARQRDGGQDGQPDATPPPPPPTAEPQTDIPSPEQRGLDEIGAGPPPEPGPETSGRMQTARADVRSELSERFGGAVDPEDVETAVEDGRVTGRVDVEGLGGLQRERLAAFVAGGTAGSTTEREGAFAERVGDVRDVVRGGGTAGAVSASEERFVGQFEDVRSELSERFGGAVGPEDVETAVEEGRVTGRVDVEGLEDFQREQLTAFSLGGTAGGTTAGESAFAQDVASIPGLSGFGGGQATRGAAGEIESELESQIESETGEFVDLIPGRDIAFEREDGQITGTLTREGRRRVDIETSELVAGIEGTPLEGTGFEAAARGGAALDFEFDLFREENRELFFGPIESAREEAIESAGLEEEVEGITQFRTGLREDFEAAIPDVTPETLFGVATAAAPVAAVEPTPFGEIGVGALAVGAGALAAGGAVERAVSVGAFPAIEAQGEIEVPEGTQPFLPGSIGVPEGSEPALPTELGVPEGTEPALPTEIGVPDESVAVFGSELAVPTDGEPVSTSELSIPEESGVINPFVAQAGQFVTSRTRRQRERERTDPLSEGLRQMERREEMRRRRERSTRERRKKRREERIERRKQRREERIERRKQRREERVETDIPPIMERLERGERRRREGIGNPEGPIFQRLRELEEESISGPQFAERAIQDDAMSGDLPGLLEDAQDFSLFDDATPPGIEERLFSIPGQTQGALGGQATIPAALAVQEQEELLEEAQAQSTQVDQIPGSVFGQFEIPAVGQQPLQAQRQLQEQATGLIQRAQQTQTTVQTPTQRERNAQVQQTATTQRLATPTTPGFPNPLGSRFADDSPQFGVGFPNLFGQPTGQRFDLRFDLEPSAQEQDEDEFFGPVGATFQNPFQTAGQALELGFEGFGGGLFGEGAMDTPDTGTGASESASGEGVIPNPFE